MTLIKRFIFCFTFSITALSTNALVVLQYHHVDTGTPSSTSVSPDQFLQHMQLIEELGFEVVDLETTTRALLQNSQIEATDKQVAISFDDAYASIFTHAYI